MKRLLVVMVVALWSSVAWAQVTGDETETPSPPPPPPPLADPEPPPPPPQLAPVVEPEIASAPIAAVDRPTRPEGNTIAIGIGWDFPTELQAPNVTSVRFRHSSGLTLEPHLAFTYEGSKAETPTLPDEKTQGSTIVVGVLGRWPMFSNGKVDFEIAGGIGYGREFQNPDGSDNDITSTLFGLSYGLAVGYWFSPHFYLTVTGMNPVYTRQRDTQAVGPNMDVSMTSTNVGAVFDPNVFVMLHLYL